MELCLFLKRYKLKIKREPTRTKTNATKLAKTTAFSDKLKCHAVQSLFSWG